MQINALLVTYKHWLIVCQGTWHIRLGLPAFGRSLLTVDAEHPVGQLGQLLQVVDRIQVIDRSLGNKDAQE